MTKDFLQNELDETLSRLYERRTLIAAYADKNIDFRLDNINRAIISIRQYSKLNINNLLSSVDIESALLLIRNKFLDI